MSCLREVIAVPWVTHEAHIIFMIIDTRRAQYLHSAMGQGLEAEIFANHSLTFTVHACIYYYKNIVGALSINKN